MPGVKGCAEMSLQDLLFICCRAAFMKRGFIRVSVKNCLDFLALKLKVCTYELKFTLLSDSYNAKLMSVRRGEKCFSLEYKVKKKPLKLSPKGL